jgi:hypothetical protein
MIKMYLNSCTFYMLHILAQKEQLNTTFLPIFCCYISLSLFYINLPSGNSPDANDNWIILHKFMFYFSFCLDIVEPRYNPSHKGPGVGSDYRMSDYQRSTFIHKN